MNNIEFEMYCDDARLEAEALLRDLGAELDDSDELGYDPGDVLEMTVDC